MPTISLACGTSYEEWYHFDRNIPLDPANLDKRASTLLFDAYLKDFQPDRYSAQKEKKKQYLSIAEAINNSGRKLTVGKITRYSRDMCREMKYSDTYYSVEKYVRTLGESSRKTWVEKVEPSCVSNCATERVSTIEYKEFDKPNNKIKNLIGSRVRSNSGFIGTYLNGMRGVCHASTNPPIEFRMPSHMYEPGIIEMANISELSFAANITIALASMSLFKDEEAKFWLAKIDKNSLNDKEKAILSNVEVILADKIPDREYQTVEMPDYRGWCYSPTIKDVKDFLLMAINDKDVPDESLVNIIKHRLNAKGYKCSNKKLIDKIISSYEKNTDNDYEKYLLAVAYLYADRYDESDKYFNVLSNNRNSQFSELSKYMLARSALLSSQKLWNGNVRDFKKIDKSKNEIAITRFNEYLSAYPKGKYASSAKGLIRRAHFLNANESEYSKLLNTAAETLLSEVERSRESSVKDVVAIKRIIEELNSHNYDELASNPLLSLQLLFNKYNGMKASTKLGEQITKLDHYLVISRLYANKEYNKVIDEVNSKSPVVEKLLLARSYEAEGKYREAVITWKMIKNERYTTDKKIYEIITKILVDNYGIEEILVDKNEIPESTKKVYLASLCTDDKQLKLLSGNKLDAQNRHIVLADLATRYLYTEEFKKLDGLFSNYSDSDMKEFGAIRTAVRDINSDKKLGRAYMNIGYYLQKSHGTPIHSLPFTVQEDKDQTCVRPVMGNGDMAGPYYYYNKALSFFNDAKDVSESKTLHFITMCFKRGHESASCRWGKSNDVSLSSKDAYNKLHSKYRGSKWAKKTRLYY